MVIKIIVIPNSFYSLRFKNINKTKASSCINIIMYRRLPIIIKINSNLFYMQCLLLVLKILLSFKLLDRNQYLKTNDSIL